VKNFGGSAELAIMIEEEMPMRSKIDFFIK
jgi:hypothetical protein